MSTIGGGDKLHTPMAFLLALFFPWMFLGDVQAGDHHGKEFRGFTDFSAFQIDPVTAANETVFTSAPIEFDIAGDELILSWNVDVPAFSRVIVQARAHYSDHATAWFTLGIWSGSTQNFPRQSVAEEKDADGEVATDILRLRRKTSAYQVRVRVTPPSGLLKFIGMSLSDSAAPDQVDPHKLDGEAWGRRLRVPELSQIGYPGGEGWCSPASSAMVMAYWGEILRRDELRQTVPKVAYEVHDINWPGTGNWAFNTAYAGSFPGIRGYVTRFSSVSEIEQWVAEGLPVVASVSYGFLKGKSEKGGGHLVVCAGFTETGEMIINDPGTRLNVEKIFSRQDFTRAWATSKNTVYLIYPMDHKVPVDRFGHWHSPR